MRKEKQFEVIGDWDATSGIVRAVVHASGEGKVYIRPPAKKERPHIEVKRTDGVFQSRVIDRNAPGIGSHLETAGIHLADYLARRVKRT